MIGRAAKLALTILMGAMGCARAQTPGTFTPTGNMTTPRWGHRATLLADGRVLITGGDNSLTTTTSSAELYDPGTGAFTVTGSMTTPRGGHTATLLPNGKVLIAGGADASPELYDPDTGTFRATGSMTTRGVFTTATLLNNGKVLFAGGFPFQTVCCVVPFTHAELYDPSTGTFTATGDMTRPGADTATLLADGKVLITRGDPGFPPPYLSSAELYDPSTGTFTFTGYTTTNHTGPTATLVTNGKVLIAGGDIGEGDGESPSAELYDPATATFAATGDLAQGREQNSATLLPDGTVLFVGGHGGWYNATAEIYDIAKASSSLIPGLPTSRELHTATLLNDGRVLITGGDDVTGSPETVLSSAELYTPTVLAPAPVLFSPWHAATGQLASPGNSAVAGEPLAMYTTGLTEGGAIPPQVAIGGKFAEILYFGAAPGYPGYFQVNVRVPSGVAPGPAVPVRLTYLGRPSNTVTIGVQ